MAKPTKLKPYANAILTADQVRKAGGVGAALRLREAQLSGISGELDGTSEAKVVQEIVRALEAKGFCKPSAWKPGAKGIYMRAGQRRADKGGSDAGLPDMVVVQFEYGEIKTYLFEVKARTKSARPSTEQAQLAALGVILIVNSAAQVLAALGR